MKKQNGITLIALVITIILMLILAGIGLNLTIGERGIFKITQGGAKNYTNAQEKELAELDNLDNTVLGIINNEKVESGSTQDKEPTFTKVANAPDIREFNKTETYYVSWDLTSSPYTINEETNLNGTPPSNWYDYTRGINHWANVKTTGGENDCYWVWIPRYAYQVPDRDSGGETINVKFLSGTTNNPIDGSSITINNNTQEGSWNLSPGFWWDKNNDGIRTADEELSGIWVAKFEASSSSVSETTVETDLTTTGGGNTNTSQVRVIPNVTSWRGITVNNIFNVCRKLTTTNNSLAGTINIDSHMMKNTEWGAVAYLSRSIYGKNSAVWNNPYFNGTANYSPITGLCGNQQSDSTNNINIYKYNETGGINASTTGNVYGVYDMAGGAWEYVAAYLSDVSPLTDYATLASAENKYKDMYAGNSSDLTANYALNTNRYGDAMFETSTGGKASYGWDSDDSYFADSSYPVFLRGGLASNGSSAGVFEFNRDKGGADTRFSFRPCLVCCKIK